MDEPLVDLDDVQGNIVPGFNKDHQTFRFLTIADAPGARRALAELVRDVSTSAMVRSFAMLRKQIKSQRDGGPSGLAATWMNIAFGPSGLSKLAPSLAADPLFQGAFKAGLAARSPLLGDPLDPGEAGHPSRWVLGGSSSPPIDVVLTVAADRRADVDDYLAGVEERLARFTAPDGGPALRALRQDLVGDTLGSDLNGHEHFGFKDGVSQPAILGRPRSEPEEFITERLLDPSSGLAARFGRPGQALVWPGQFLVGLPRQNGRDPNKPLAPFPVSSDWLRNGSFMVMRVLQQDVPSFWAQVRAFAADVFGRQDDDAVDWIAARIVGRWRSGAPIMRTPGKDDPRFVADDRVSNDFAFKSAGTRPRLVAGQPPLPELPLSVADPDARICPFAGHIRKVNPRDDAVELGSAGETLTRLLVRRGIPFGSPFADPRRAAPDGKDRGLIFVSYQASIERQFEFLMQNWVNGDDAPHSGGGRDAVLGRHRPQEGMGATDVVIADDAGTAHRLPQPVDFITPRGGGYFFAPSLAGLAALAGARPG